jgi:hypothetical protein
MEVHQLIAYAVPSLIIVAMILFVSSSNMADITGQFVGSADQNIEAQIRVATSNTRVIPLGSYVFVIISGESLNGTEIFRESSMAIEDYFWEAGETPEIKNGQMDKIGFTGQGYLGSGNYTVNLAAFDIERLLPPGQYTLKTEVRYDNTILTGTESSITF